MPFKLFDRVKQKSTTAGSGTITLSSSVAAFETFVDSYDDGDTLFYTIENLTQYEVGFGTYSGNTLSRDVILRSTDGVDPIDLPGDSNTFVFVTYPASGAVYTTGNRCVTNVDSINFNLGVTPAYSEGFVFYDNQNHALAVYNDEPDITLQVGQEEFLRVRNNTSGTIFNGEAVRILGSQGTHVTVEKAIATGDFVAQAVGLATHDIENNSFGYVTTYGVVRDLDTSNFNDGDEIFLSPEVSGGLTGVSPIAPNFKLSLGHVVRSHPTVGQIVVKPSTPKLGGGDVKSLGVKVESGVAFIDLIAGSDAAIIASTTGLLYDSGNQVLRVNAGGVRFPDGVTQTIAYTGQAASGVATTGELESVSGYLQGQITTNGVIIGFLQNQIDTNESNISGVSGLLYNNWNINVTGNVDSITSNETVVFTGLGLTTVTYDNATNIVSISGAGDGSGGSTTGVASGVAFFNRTSNEITGVSNFIYNQVLNQVGINKDPQAGLHVSNDTSAYPVLTVEAGVGQALPLTRWIDENGIVVATISETSGTFSGNGGILYPQSFNDSNRLQIIPYTGPEAITASVSNTINLSCSDHAGKYLRTLSASPVVITIPSGLGCELNSEFTVEQAAAGSVNFSAAAGVTLNSFNSATGIEGQYGVVRLKQVGIDTYTLYGDIA
jgi:hypothetical protein